MKNDQPNEDRPHRRRVHAKTVTDDRSPLTTTFVLIAGIVMVIGACFYLLMNDSRQSMFNGNSGMTSQPTSQPGDGTGQPDAHGRMPGHLHYMHDHP